MAVAPNSHTNETPTSSFASSVALVFIMICLIIYILHVASAILIPFVVAIFVWYLINASARWLNKISLFKMHIPRVLCFAISLIVLVCGFWFIAELLAKNIAYIVNAAPIYQENFQKIAPQLVSLFHLEHTPTIRDLISYIDVASIMKTAAKMLGGIAGKTLIVIFYVGFLLYEQRFFDNKIIGMIEDKRAENRARQALANIDAKMQRYIGVKSFVSVIDSLLTFGILSFYDVDLAAVISLFAFFLHFIPYAGSFIAIVVPSLIALIHNGDIVHALMVAGSLMLSHAFLGHFLDPFLMGDKLNLSPIFILSSLAMWGMVWGIPGMFLAVPILSMIMITLAQFTHTHPFAVLISKTGVISTESSADNKKED